MSKLLLDEKPLLIMPMLATKIGLNESIIIQQIHYWNEINKVANNNYRDGYYWTFNSVSQWQEQFPFWAKNTIQRIITNLEKMKLVVSGNYNKLKIDRTKWYRIDYKVLGALEGSPFTHIGSKRIPLWVKHLADLGLPLPENNSEINTKNNDKRYSIKNNGGRLFKYYNDSFENTFDKEHPTITKEQLIKSEIKLSNIAVELDLSNDDIMDCIDYHFENLAAGNDGKIFSFIGNNAEDTPIKRYIDY